MRLKVEIAFVDKYTGELHDIGDIITVEKARGEELLSDSRKVVSPIEKTSKKAK
ncbi:MAG: hypothetical protein MJ000_11690 [Bacteroidales bacterium]|nr:hypothetical protein [Bacteroidales bacterium]